MDEIGVCMIQQCLLLPKRSNNSLTPQQSWANNRLLSECPNTAVANSLCAYINDAHLIIQQCIIKVSLIGD